MRVKTLEEWSYDTVPSFQSISDDRGFIISIISPKKLSGMYTPDKKKFGNGSFLINLENRGTLTKVTLDFYHYGTTRFGEFTIKTELVRDANSIKLYLSCIKGLLDNYMDDVSRKISKFTVSSAVAGELLDCSPEKQKCLSKIESIR